MGGFSHTLFLENEEQTSEKKYMVMFFYSIENHMQKFRHFWGKKKHTQNRHLAPFCTHPFNYFMTNFKPLFIMPLGDNGYFTYH